MVLHQGRGTGQIGPVVVEIDRIGHGPPLVAEELGSVLRGDDSHRVGRKAVAEHLDRHVRQARFPENDPPWFIETEERPSWPSTRYSQMFRARRPRHHLEQPDGFRPKEDPASSTLRAITFGPWNPNAGDIRVEATPFEPCQEQLRTMADTGVDCHSERVEGTYREGSYPTMGEATLEITENLANGCIPLGVEDVFGVALFESGNQFPGRGIAGSPLHTVGKPKGRIELLESAVGDCSSSSSGLGILFQNPLGDLTFQAVDDLGRDL